MNNADDKKMEIKSEKSIEEMLSQIEKLVDKKLEDLKTFVPVLFAVVTSVIAFLLVFEVDMGSDAAKVVMVSLGALLSAFVTLIVSYFGRTYYKAVERKTTMEFVPHKLHSYCFLSDEEFLDSIKKYANRILTEKEVLAANFLKQKINEYVVRRNPVNRALTIVAVGATILAITCIFGAFMEF